MSSWLTLCPGDTTLCSVLLFSAQHWCLSTLGTLTSLLLLCLALVLFCPGNTLAWGQTSPGTNPHFLSTGSLLLCVQLHGQYASLGTWAVKQGRKGENENNLFTGKNLPCSSPHAVFSQMGIGTMIWRAKIIHCTQIPISPCMFNNVHCTLSQSLLLHVELFHLDSVCHLLQIPPEQSRVWHFPTVFL